MFISATVAGSSVLVRMATSSVHGVGSEFLHNTMHHHKTCMHHYIQQRPAGAVGHHRSARLESGFLHGTISSSLKLETNNIQARGP
jgi:hypothetical protein